MLRARPGRFRVTDFQTGGLPDLTWYTRYNQFWNTVYLEEGGLEAMLVPDGVQNAAGQQIIPQQKVRPKNEVRDASNWYLEAMTASPPVISAGRYAEGREDDLRLLIEEMIRICTVTGHGLLVLYEDNTLEVVNGINIAPIVQPGNPVPGGWIQFWPYYQRATTDRVSQRITVPNRMKIKTYTFATRVQTQEKLIFSGGVLGMRATQTAEDRTRDPQMVTVTPFGVDEGFYPEALKYAGEIARLDAVMREIATTYALPVPVVNTKVGLTNAGGGLVDLHGNPVQTGQVRALQSVDPDGPPIEYAQAQMMLEELAGEREEWRTRMHGVTRIPKDITENQETRMSGVSRALLARPAVDWIESTQRSITQALDIMISLITGSARGGVTIEWPRQPFDTLEQRRIIAREQYLAGIITLNEAREYINLPPVANGDVFYAGSEGTSEQSPRTEPEPTAAG